MKSKKNLMAVLTLLIIASTASAASRKYVVLASPYLEAADRQAAFQELTKFILAGAAAGDELAVLDGVRLEIVADFQIPSDELFRRSPTARARALAGSLAKLKQFFGTESPHPPRLKATVMVPQALDLTVSHLRRPGQTLTVVVIGSPFYADENGAFDMVEAFVPSDEHLRVSSRESVFGTRGKEAALQGVVVHYCYLKEAFQHAEHRDAVHRFWYLFVNLQAGTLASFAASPSIVFHRLTQGMHDPVMQARLDENDRELVMRRVELRRREVRTTGTTNQVDATVRERGQTNAVVSPPAASARIATDSRAVSLSTNSELLRTVIPNTIRAGKNGIGIVWAVHGQARRHVDVDLYVRAGSSPAELFYGATQAPWGKYLRDVLHASGESAFTIANPREQWEYVELESSVPLRDTSVWVNVFRNESREAIHGIIIVAENGQVSQGSFDFPAGLTGDAGTKAAEREGDPSWLRIDVAALLDRRPNSQP